MFKQQIQKLHFWKVLEKWKYNTSHILTFFKNKNHIFYLFPTFIWHLLYTFIQSTWTRKRCQKKNSSFTAGAGDYNNAAPPHSFINTQEQFGIQQNLTKKNVLKNGNLSHLHLNFKFFKKSFNITVICIQGYYMCEGWGMIRYSMHYCG